MKIKQETNNINISKKVGAVFVCIVSLYLILAVLVYIIAGDDFISRNSRGNIVAPEPNNGVSELYDGQVLEYTFSAPIHHMQTLNIQWGNYRRECAGAIFVELINIKDDSLILSQTYDSAVLQDGEIASILFPENIDLYNLPLKLSVRSDSAMGMGGTILINTDIPDEKNTLTLNGEPVEGTLCISVIGTDDIWLGKNYFLIVGAFGILISTAFFISWLRFRRGKKTLFANTAYALFKYKFLVKQFVSRDFKTKYKRSVLGVLWSFVNPLLTMLVQYMVFSTIFKSDISNFPVYLLVGVVSFNFFSEACGMALSSIIGNSHLITKVYMPKYIYPFTRVLSSLINLGISFIPLIGVCLFTGVVFTWKALLSLYFFACLILFSLGLGMLLASLMVFFRDTQFLWGVLSMIWMYMTPVFYPESILPDEFKFVLTINPLGYFIKGTRSCIIDGISPEPIFYIQCMLMALGMLIIGSLIFKKSQDKFILYL